MPFLTQGKTNWKPQRNPSGILRGKYILIVLILAIIVGGGILGYLSYFKREMVSLTKFPEIKKPEKVVEDETANWKTYRNEEYGFEIKYPPQYNIWFEKEEPKTEYDVEKFRVAFESSDEYLPKFQSFGVTLYKPKISEEIAIFDIAGELEPENWVCEQDLTILKDIPTVRCHQKEDAGEGEVGFYPRKFYFISSQHFLFEIEYLHLNLYDNEKLIKQMLSTFKFSE